MQQQSSTPVRSTPLPSRKESAIIRRSTLRKQRGTVERATAWIVLVLSVFGTVATLAGGWTPLIASIVARTPLWSAIIGGFAVQGVLTFLEWYYFDKPLVSWPARVLDTLMTMIGYGPLVLVPLVAILAAKLAPAQATQAAWGIIGLVSLLIAWYPESRLVD